MAFGPDPLDILLLVLLGGGFGLPSAVPPTAEDPLAQKIAPADCLFYKSWAGTGTPNAAGGNHTEAMLAEPEVQKFLDGGVDSFFGVFSQLQTQPDEQEVFANVAEALKLIRGKAGAFYISDFQMPDFAPPDVRGGGLLNMVVLGVAITEILNGTANTIMTVEAADESAVIWTKPAHLSPNVDEPTKGLTGMRPGGFLVGFADGRVRFIAGTIGAGTLRALFTKSGGEAVELP